VPPGSLRPRAQLTGSAALLARMRKSRAVTGEAAAEPSGGAAAPAATAAKTTAAVGSDAGAARVAFDGSVYFLYGGEAATQVAAELAAAARGAGLAPQLVALSDFRSVKLETCAPSSHTLARRCAPACTRARAHPTQQLMRALLHRAQ
jgi:hypothetical protein